MIKHRTTFSVVQVFTRGSVPHRWYQLYWNNAWLRCPCCYSRKGWAQAGKLPPCSAWQTCHVRWPGQTRERSGAWFYKGNKLFKNDRSPHLPDNGSLAIQAAVPADEFIPRLSRHKDIVQLVNEVLFQGLSVLIFTGGEKKGKKTSFYKSIYQSQRAWLRQLLF